MIAKKNIFNLGGPPLSDPKHGEPFYTAPRNSDLKKNISAARKAILFQFFFFLTYH